MHPKTKYVKAYRERNFDKGCCTICGQSMPENDMRTTCDKCRRKHNTRNLYQRWFVKLFT